MIRGILIRLQNLVRLGTVDRGEQIQLQGGDVSPAVPHYEPQGVHFGPVPGARCVVLSPNGVTAQPVALGQSASVPGASIGAGEGGLHYQGTFKVYLAADGTVALGEQMPADFVALASKVNAYISGLHTVLSTWVPVSMDGGAALQLAYNTKFTTAPASVGSTKVRAL